MCALRHAVHACVCAVSFPHLAAIRMCATVTVVRQHKCVAQMARRGWGGAGLVRAKQGNSTKQRKMEAKCTADSKGRQNDLVEASRNTKLREQNLNPI